MGKSYELKVKIPTGSVEAHADDLESLALLAPSGISTRIVPQAACREAFDLETAAHELLVAYRGRRMLSNSQGSRISEAGLDTDLIKCYLRNMTIAETIKWLREEKKFKTSRSAVGRHWRDFKKLGAASIRAENRDNL